MENLRAFIAIELPEAVKDSLAGLQQKLRAGGETPSVKWTDPAGIHLTLKFLGNVAAHKVAPITQAMAEAAQGVPPFQLRITQLGVFPSLASPRVAWTARRSGRS